MAIAKLRGDQLKNAVLRDNHFDAANPINENKVAINWASHTEILQNKKIDAYVQITGKDVSSVSSIVLTELDGVPVAVNATTEGVVLTENVIIRESGTPDSAVYDADGDIVYGKLTENAGTYTLSFYSVVGGTETAFTMPASTTIDLVYVRRVNLLTVPVDAIIRGGASFVEDAVDVKAYLNLTQLMLDLYGGGGTLDNDGQANLAKSITQEIADLKDTGGADIIGVVADSNYTGTSVQDVLSDLAFRLVAIEEGGGAEVLDTHTRDSASANGVFSQKTGGSAFTSLEARLIDIETVVDAQVTALDGRVDKLESEDDRDDFTVTGSDTATYTLPGGKKAKPNSLFISINGAIQARGINYTETTDGGGNITGVDFNPDTLLVGDVVVVWWKNAL